MRGISCLAAEPVSFSRRTLLHGVSKLFFFTVHISGDASVCSEKMAAPGEKSFCVLEYHTSKSVVTVQRAFSAKYAKDPPTDKTTETGCLCKQTRVWQELEYRINVCCVARGAHTKHL